MFGKKRRSALDDIQKNAAGEYIYTGAFYRYATPELPRKTALMRLWLMGGLSAGAALTAGVLPAPGAMDAFYVVIPYVLGVIAEVSVLWALGRLSLGGDPVRAYVWETAVTHLPRRALLAAVLLGLAVLGECLFLLLHRDSGPMAAAFLALLLASGALLLGCRRLLGKLRWERL